MFIDISPQLLNIIPLLSSEIQLCDATITSLHIPKYSCNDADYTVFDLSRLTRIESIEIGDECFESVKTFKINGLSRLKTIKIGKNSFTQKMDWFGDNKSKSFHILNCISLESIQIGEYSFSDYAGKFELRNLPQLQSIQIGTIGSNSCNFYSHSFVIRRTDMVLNM